MAQIKSTIKPEVNGMYAFLLNRDDDFELSNRHIENISGINKFFETAEEYRDFLKDIKTNTKSNRKVEFGDFQTSVSLCDLICQRLQDNNIAPDIFIEPTCGVGNFIISAIKFFPSLKEIYGIEIYKPYIWKAKIEVLNHFIQNKDNKPPQIFFYHSNIFNFNFQSIIKKNQNRNFLILGNPPWVTNSQLASLNSRNLPLKSNRRGLSGLDAITGKSNFDIAESIAIKIIENFHKQNGHFGFLVKNTVIRNIVFNQNQTAFNIGNLKKYGIDANKEFNISAEASLFSCSFNTKPELICDSYDIYQSNKKTHQFGWIKDKFISNGNGKHIDGMDGISPFEWRQGIKHDCVKVLELSKNKDNNCYLNGYEETVNVEDDLIYGLLKSSDLKGGIIDSSRKYLIVTQKFVGQNTAYLNNYPKTKSYLLGHKADFEKRKSIIYKNKFIFSIFGVGDYTFKPYKVAISGMYKNPTFSLVLPNKKKPLILDDTCYFLGFDKLYEALFCYILLNKTEVKNLLDCIVFYDSKRVFTKNNLMRIDLGHFVDITNFFSLNKALNDIPTKILNDIKENDWMEFVKGIKAKNNNQLTLSF